MKKLFTVMLVCLMCSVVIGQEKDAGEFEFDVQFATLSLPFDGSEAVLISGQPMIGIKKDLDVGGLEFSPGLYMNGDLSFNNGRKSNWSVGLALYSEFFQGVGVGVSYNALMEGRGFEGPNEETLFLIIGYDINF